MLNRGFANAYALLGNSWSAINLISVQTQQQTQQTEPLPSKENLRKLITRRQDLNNKECRKFLEDVLKNLKIGGTIEELYDKFIKKHGFVETGTAGGYSDDGKGNIMLPTLQAATNDSERYQKQMRFVGVVIHELFHRAGKSHSDMAKAAYDALSEAEKSTTVRPKGDAASSTFMSQQMNDKCKIDIYNAQEVKANVIP